jgi:malonate-semialdehyde dehydrogenase (acetylating)/methylmalonate-semialdehyde dehydrogenase
MCRVHGSANTVNRICDHPAIKAISFVGGDAAGTHIYERSAVMAGMITPADFRRATPLGKRVQANLGAKNHCVIMPDGEGPL